MTTPFDMSKTIRHPDVIHARIQSVIEQISYHRLAIEAREKELEQLNGMVLEMLHSKPIRGVIWTEEARP